MKGGKKPQGYTIIEVMIFLVITSVLLISALAIFRGQQGRTQFTQAIRETDARIRTMINEVGTGYFPSTGGFSCQRAGNGNTQIITASGEQGTRSNCLFLGKTLQLCPVVSATVDCTQYNIDVMAGLRKTQTGTDVRTLQDANPTLVITDPLKLTENYSVPYKVPVSKVVIIRNGSIVPGDLTTLAFVSSLSTTSSTGESGNQSVDMAVIPGFTRGQNTSQLLTAVNSLSESDKDIERAIICFRDGTNGRAAAIAIGGAGRQLTTDTFIDSVPTECVS